ncbi:lead, cadmium, zinc and mercury transporting ATPase/opper-translocating P-type ATPase [Halomonas beimenensis]|uniref:P-type Zn(2+) transporter n=2 Tax=Halomonas beimenensis TaxID=475662 RepID=A0A291P427_9GAMM|nr:lead, cadmium, zinc and mercury transporting ATPase/opper-translocating P-type ATPase [Halomonas beimenensis]
MPHVPTRHAGCCGSGPARPPRKAVEAPPGTTTLRRRIAEMDCPTEEALLRKALAQAPGVEGLDFDLMNRVLSIHHRGAVPAELDRRIRELGMTPRAENEADAAPASPREPWGRMALAIGLALAAELVGWTAWSAGAWLSPPLALAAIALVGLPTWRKGWAALRHRSLNINALMSVAVTGALLIGHWAEAAMVMVLFTLAERLEARSLDRARGAIRALLDRAPDRARRQTPAGDWESIAASEVAVGEVVRVLPGERLPLDGVIVRGTPTLDESPITGESLPRDKGPGEAIYAGTINRHGDFDYRATRPADDSTLARIIHAVEAAQASRAPTQRFIDRFSAIYTPAVLSLAVVTALAWPWLFPGAWLEGVYRALVLLVIACPCALVISTPVTIVSALSSAARAGILIKGGRFLEQGHRLAWLALDKTGTLTRGEPTLADWRPLDDSEGAPLARQAAGLAGRSTHPVSRAVHQALAGEGDEVEVQDFRERPGLGVEGEVDGEALWLGNRRMMTERGHGDPALTDELDALAEHGDSVVLLGDARRVRALFSLRDVLKPGSQAAIAALHELGVKTLVLSGDAAPAVDAIATEAGIDEARGELLPEDKLAAIEALGDRGVIGMVGDGINDAPALARADIGFAMGAAGSDAAIETADVALMDDDPGKLPTFLRLSRATRRVLIQNIALALGLKAVFLVLAFTGQATLWMAVFADMGASLLVVANGLRLLRGSAPPTGTQEAAVTTAG